MCFCGRPTVWYRSVTETVPFWEGSLFCALLDERDVLYEWRPERAEAVRPRATLELRDCQFRFEGVLWTRTTQP